MKNFLILPILFVVVNAIGSAQVKNTAEAKPTTEDEYNYGIAGYRLQLQMKLPMRKGYTLEDIVTVERGDRKSSFKALLRQGEKKPCAVIIIYDRPRVNPEYLCLPTSDASAELWEKFFVSLHSDTENEQERLRFFSFAIARAMMNK